MIEIDSDIEEVGPPRCNSVKSSFLHAASNSTTKDQSDSQDLIAFDKTGKVDSRLLILSNCSAGQRNNNSKLDLRKTCPVKRKLRMELKSPDKVQKNESDHSLQITNVFTITESILSVESPSKLKTEETPKQSSLNQFGSFSFEIDNSDQSELEGAVEIKTESIAHIVSPIEPEVMSIDEMMSIDSTNKKSRREREATKWSNIEMTIIEEASKDDLNTQDVNTEQIEKQIKKKEEDLAQLLRLVFLLRSMLWGLKLS